MDYLFAENGAKFCLNVLHLNYRPEGYYAEFEKALTSLDQLTVPSQIIGG